jgi:hypothetical protein
MSTSLRLRLLTLLTFATLACGPAFPRADERECALQPAPGTCTGCTVFVGETRPLSSTRRVVMGTQMQTVDGTGWKPLELNWPPSFDALLDVTEDEVLAVGHGQQTVSSVTLSTGEVRLLALLERNMPWRWGRGTTGFWVVTGNRLIPSSPRTGPRVITLPGPLAVSFTSTERPLETLSSVGLVLPSSVGLFTFEPSHDQPMQLVAVARGAFTSAVRLGTELYAARCTPKALPASPELQSVAIVGHDSPCQVIRLTEGRSDDEAVVATLPGLVELAAFRDRLVARTFGGLFTVTREGHVQSLYADTPITADAGIVGRSAFGALMALSPTISFRQQDCRVELDDARGTVVSAVRAQRDFTLGGRRVFLAPAGP